MNKCLSACHSLTNLYEGNFLRKTGTGDAHVDSLRWLQYTLRVWPPTGKWENILRKVCVDQSLLCPQDIEKTMSTALHELRELERQNTVKQAPDVVLDTLEPLKNPPGPISSEPASPLHTIVIRDPDAAMRRSSSSSTEMMTTFKPALSARLAGAQLRPPPMRPVRPVVQHRSSSSSSSGVGSPAVTPTEKMFPNSSSDKSGTM